jgi:hypothetical protein
LRNNDEVSQFLHKALLGALIHLYGISQMSAITTAFPTVPSQKHNPLTEQQSCELLHSSDMFYITPVLSREIMGSLLPHINWPLAKENSGNAHVHV